MLSAEPWRIEAFIEEEAVIQRHRLCTMLLWLRILIATFSLLYFLITRPYDHAHWTVITLMLCYIALVYGLMRLVDNNRGKIYLYNFFIAVFEVLLLGYLSTLSRNDVPLSFLFFSVALSALLLPLWRLLLVVLVAAMIFFIQWFGIQSVLIRLFLKEATDSQNLIEAVISSQNGNIFITLLLGLFGLAIVVNRLANWSFKNDVKARFRHKQMRQVLAFNRSVIEHLKSGVIVVSGNGKILSINRRSIDLLNIQTTQAIMELSQLSQELQHRYQQWLSAGVVGQTPYRHNASAEDVFVTFDHFGEGTLQNIAMITLESVNEIMQQTQEAKLAALGRLTAGVAHEIRNPLSAINSASQLLSETSKAPAHQKLAQVILKNVKRTDQIITDILGLFTDTTAERTLLSVQKTLPRYAKEFLDVHQNDNFTLRINGKEEQELFFYFDAGQLEQVLWNLLQNAMKYARSDNLILTIRYGLSESRRSLHIDIMDNGKGVHPDKVSQIFEPFYTGGNGSGLGLYLVRELCNANNANITYLPIKTHVKKARSGNKTQTVGACFRITTQVYFSKKLKPTLN